MTYTWNDHQPNGIGPLPEGRPSFLPYLGPGAKSKREEGYPCRMSACARRIFRIVFARGDGSLPGRLTIQVFDPDHAGASERRAPASKPRLENLASFGAGHRSSRKRGDKTGD